MAVVALVNADVCNTNDRVSRFGNYLRNNCLPPATGDAAVIELASRAFARLTQVSGTLTANVKFELIDHEVKRAFEVLSSGDRGEGRQFSAVLLLREIAFSMPTFFFQNISRFFEASLLRVLFISSMFKSTLCTFKVVFFAIWDSKLSLREAAVNALRAGLIVTAQRETSKQMRHQHLQWYRLCYQEALRGLRQQSGGTQQQQLADKRITREDRVHGAIMVLLELMRCSNSDWERTNHEVEENILNEENMEGGSPASINRRRLEERGGGGGLGLVKRYYQSGFRGRASSYSSTTSAATGSMVSVSSQIPFSWYGTVMVGKEAIVESTQCRHMLLECYDEMCSHVLSITGLPWASRNASIQSTLLLILPRMAALDRERFSEKFLPQTVRFVDRLLQERNRQAFVTVGLLAVAVSTNIRPHLRSILAHVRLNLPNRENPSKKRITKLDPAIFACISMLARAGRDTIRNEVGDLLESMLSVGLSPALTTALHELACSIPVFKVEIAEGLLKILSLILMQQPYLHPGTPRKLLTPSHLQALTGASPVPEHPETSAIVLGLRTLGSFDFEGHSLLTFVRHCANHYLQSEEKPIRLEAVKTCASLLKGAMAALGERHSQTVMSTINDVLAKLLVAGITDRDSDVRWCVMDSFDECFDYHLAQAENLSALFVALNDEVFEIREQTICIIGRLTVLNPAYILPSLRKTLMELLTEMEHSGIGRNKEQSAKMLGHLVANAPTITCSYVQPIMKVLLPKLKETDHNPMVITSVLRAVGDLALVSGTLMKVNAEERSRNKLINKCTYVLVRTNMQKGPSLCTAC